MSSHCIVPNWNLKHQQRQQQVEAAAAATEPEPEPEPDTSSHVNKNNNSHLFPMSLSNYEVAELRWENGQLAKHGLGVGGPIPAKPTWVRSNDTLESIVHQATVTCHNNNMNKEMTLNLLQHDHQNSQAKISSNMVASSGRKQVPVVPRQLEKRTRADSDQFGRNFSGMLEEKGDRSACASANATFSRDNNNDTTLMTWASYESPQSYKTKTTDEDSAFHYGSEKQDDDRETKINRSHSSRRSRAAAIHNQSERRRRDRINQKLKTLQRLVPNASKTDKASMLDEVIDYLKQLQAQVQMMNNVRNNMPQMNMMMPLGMQQQLQMSLLARMGMGVGLGMGMGMLDMNSMAAAAARSAPQSLPPLIHASAGAVSPFLVPPMIATCPPAHSNSDPGDTNNASSVHLPDPYCALLAQSMNVELYNKMAALFRQQVNQSTQQMATRSPSTQSNHMQGD